MADIETHPVYDLEHLPGHREIRRPKYAVKYWTQSETCQRNPRKYTLIAKSDSQRTIRNIMRRIDTQNGNLDTPVVETTGFLRTGLACTRALGQSTEASHF